MTPGTECTVPLKSIFITTGDDRKLSNLRFSGVSLFLNTTEQLPDFDPLTLSKLEAHVVQTFMAWLICLCQLPESVYPTNCQAGLGYIVLILFFFFFFKSYF